jgi:putative phosphoesterase
MKIALISDIHSNLPALEAVLAHAHSQGVETFWCMGDLLHFNAYPQEVVKTIRKLDAVCIYGNIDCQVMDLKKLIEKKKEIPDDQQPLVWTYQQLTPKSRKYLADLPMTRRLKLNGSRFLLVHGSPVAFDDPIYSDTPDARLRELARMTKAEFIICGHTHKPFVREVEGVTFINPGSVGKPIDGDPRACYAIMKVKKDVVSIEPFRVSYDLAGMIQKMKEVQLPELYIRSMEMALGHTQVEQILNREQGK